MQCLKRSKVGSLDSPSFSNGMDAIYLWPLVDILRVYYLTTQMLSKLWKVYTPAYVILIVCLLYFHETKLCSHNPLSYCF